MPLENIWKEMDEDIIINSEIRDWTEDEPLLQHTTIIEIDDGTELVVDHGIINSESGFFLLFEEPFWVFDCESAETDDEWFWDMDFKIEKF